MSARVTVFEPGGTPVEVDAYPTPVPGLVIIRDHGDGTLWAVVHEPSGGAACSALPDPEFALHVAIALAEVGDWTRSLGTLRADPDFGLRWERVLERTGAGPYHDSNESPPLPDAPVTAGGAP